MSKIKYVLLVAWLLLFTSLRLYGIQNTNALFGDSARDLLELHEWQQTLLPPLLGPHTSALSFNQSAWYFYFLMPFYLLSFNSIYTTNIAVLAYYLGWFTLGTFAVKKKWISLFELLILVVFTTLQPELIKQLRAVWNPSFVFPITLAVGLMLIRANWRTMSVKTIGLFALALSLAVGLSYSVVPFAGVAVLYAFYQLWKFHPAKIARIVQLFLALLGSFALVNIGTIVYELRYHFLLTKNLGNQQVLQLSSDQLTKWSEVIQFTFYSHWAWFLLILGVLLSFVWWRKRPENNRELLTATGLLFLTIGVTLYFPFTIFEHYIFGILALVLVVLLSLPVPIQKSLLFAFGCIWLYRLVQTPLFAPQLPTTAQKRACLAQVCADAGQPIYVVGNTPSHDHQALEYSYLAKEIKCDAFAVTEVSYQRPTTVAVFNQQTQFTLGSTDFYELNVFAKGNLVRTIECTPELSVTLFESE